MFKISLTANRKEGLAEILEELLVSSDKDVRQWEQTEDGKKTSVAFYSHFLRKARGIQKELSSLGLKGVRVSIKEIRKRDWQEKWKRQLKPFQLTDRFDVVPLWHKRNYRKKKREPIFLDTTLAFGTGLHETTRFLAQLVEQRIRKAATFLDVGTGTGILSIVAEKCGAGKVEACDISAQSVEVARKNFEINRCRFFKLSVCNIRKSRNRKRYDFVAANLTSQDLMAVKRRLCALVKPGKHLAVSGISLSNLLVARKAFGGLPLKCLQVKKGKEWAALLFKHL